MSISVSVRLVSPWGDKRVEVRCEDGARLGDALRGFLDGRQEIEDGCPESARKVLEPVLGQELPTFARSNMIVLNRKSVDASLGALDTKVSDGDEILVIPSILAG